MTDTKESSLRLRHAAEQREELKKEKGNEKDSALTNSAKDRLLYLVENMVRTRRRMGFGLCLG